MELQGFQRRWLRGRAHGLDPVVHVGKSGSTDGVRQQLDAALTAHELIKVRFVGGLEKAEKQALADALCTATGAALAGLVGHVGIFYRPHPEAERRRLVLPSRDEENGTDGESAD